MTDYRYIDDRDPQPSRAAIAVLSLVVSVLLWISYCVAAAYLP